MKNVFIAVLVVIVLFGLGRSWENSIKAKEAKTSATALPAATRQYNTDELLLLTNSCGKPTSDKLKDVSAYRLGPDAVERIVTYSHKNLELQFLKNSTNTHAWTFVGAFNVRGDDSSFSPEELHQRMPCTRQFSFHPFDP